MIPEVPPLLHERLEAQYGAELAREIEAGYVRKRTTFRVNPLKGDRDAVLREIADAGIATEPVAWYDDAFLLPDGNEEQLRALPCYDAGAIYLQSLSSMLPALVLAPKSGETVLDMAAAPGGKTTQMAALSGGKALITACEKNAIRADRLQFNLTRQGARAVNIMRQDARLLDSLFKFDKILLDAPCSGSGTLLLEDAGHHDHNHGQHRHAEQLHDGGVVAGFRVQHVTGAHHLRHVVDRSPQEKARQLGRQM